MAITYRWTIESLECIPSQDELQDVVYKAYWVYSGSDEEMYSGTKHGLIDLPDPDSDSFIPYDELDEATVVAWVATQFTDEQISAMQTDIELEIASLKSLPTVIKPLPWKK